jgi:hypothetical protein
MKQSQTKRPDFLTRFRQAGIRHKQIGLVLGWTANRVTQKLNNYLSMSADEEKQLLVILKTAERREIK